MPGIICSGEGCTNKPKYDIIFDCGVEDQRLILCQQHYDSNPVFQKNIKKKDEIKN